MGSQVWQHQVKLNGDLNFLLTGKWVISSRNSYYVIQNPSSSECNYHPLTLTNSFPCHAELQLYGLFSLWHICFLSYKSPREETADFTLHAHLFLLMLMLMLDRICGLFCYSTCCFRQIFFKFGIIEISSSYTVNKILNCSEIAVQLL